VDVRPLEQVRRRADIVLGRVRVAVFMDGCFWHGCARHGRVGGRNRAWWELKIHRNRLRDLETDRTLRRSGWLPLRFWEHEDPRTVASEIADAVSCRVPTGKRRRASRGLS